MEQTNNFIGGLHSDFNEQNQPPNTYRDALNWVRDFDGSLTNEKGTSTTILNLPNKRVVGSCIIEDELVLFFQHNEIGYVKNDTYYPILIREDLNLLTKINSRGKINYKNDRIIYFVDGKNEDRVLTYNPNELPITDINANLSLQVTSKQPIITLQEVTDTGNLPTGIYQFSARLVTSTGNKTNSSLMSEPISITNEVGSTSLSVDGAIPQTNGIKAISILIDNLDPKFKLVEIIATSYYGITNTPRHYVVGLKPIINGQAAFLYESIDQNGEEVTLDELTIDPINYNSSKLIELKDNYLFRGGVTVNKQDISLQQVANNTIIKYVIKTLPYSETVSINLSTKNNDGTSTYIPYKDNIINTYLRGYQRGEVYSFSITPKFKAGGYGWAYHIPSTSNQSSANTTTKQLGKYTSTLDYPTGYDYPVGKITHHRMPTLQQEPIYDGNNIRVLGIELTIDLASYLTPEELDLLDGVVICRERRGTNNKSILTQGIAQNLVLTGGDQNLLMVSPFNGKPSYDYDGDSNKYKRDYVAFYSPETIFNQDNLASANRIEPIATVIGRSYLLGDKREGGRDEKYAHTFLNFTNYSYTPKISSSINRDTIQYIPAEQPNFRLTISNITERVSTKECNGYLFFKTNTPLSIFRNDVTQDLVSGKAELTYHDIPDATDNVNFQTNNFTTIQNQNDANYQGDVSRLIYNLVADRNSQYGDVLGKEYIPIAERLFDIEYTSRIDDSVLPSNRIECFNGDVFINKVAIMSTTAEVDSNNIDNSGLKFRTLNYIMLESTVNTALRHYITSGDQQTIPYFPKYSNLWKSVEGNGLLNIEPRLGHSNGYNKQYSFDNRLKKFFSKSLLEPEEQTTLSNRIIYSEVSIEGEQFDANRVFLPNNYHDIPRNKGVLTDMFVQSNILYFHTPQTLYRSYTNEQTALITTSGQVATGNGGLFPRPSIEMTAINGGYGGSLTQNGCNTPYGRFFLDQIQKKVFLLSDSLQEISINNISKYLQDNVDNNEATSVFDYKNRRWIISTDNSTIKPELINAKVWRDDEEFISSLQVGDIVFKDGKYKRII